MIQDTDQHLLLPGVIPPSGALEKMTLAGQVILSGLKAENAHQGKASLIHANGNDYPLAVTRFEQIQGTPMGMVNLTDLSRGVRVMTQAVTNFRRNKYDDPCFAFGLKHGNCCGGSYAENSHYALRRMLDGDPESIFGGFVVVNFPIDEQDAEALIHHNSPERRLLDGIAAPAFTDEAIEILKTKTGRCRLLVNTALGELDDGCMYDGLIHVPLYGGGWITQQSPTFVPDFHLGNKAMKGYGPIAINQNITDLLLGHAICAGSNSNTMVFVRGNMLIGNGVGQQKRVKAVEVALMNVRQFHNTAGGASVVSDSFFPFPDGVEAIVKSGAKAIFATSGSKRQDPETIKYCEKHDVTLFLMDDAEARGFSGHMG